MASQDLSKWWKKKQKTNLWLNPSILHSESDSKNVTQSQGSAFSLTGCE